MTQVGQCPHCRAMNSYEVAQCLDCRQALPWAGTVQKYTSQMQAARNTVQQLQAQVQQLQQTPTMPRMPVATTSTGVPIPPPPSLSPATFEGELAERETGRFHDFIAALIGEKAAEFFADLNEDRARIAAFLLAGLWDLCVLIGVWLILRNLSALFSAWLPFGSPATTPTFPGLTPTPTPAPSSGPGLSFTTIIKILAVSTFAWGVLVGGSALVRIIGRGEGSFAGDLFISGVTLLPVGLFLVLAGAVGITNYDFAGILWIFAICYAVVALYRGLVTVSKVASSVAAVCVPLVFLLDGFALKVLVTRLLTP